MKRVLELVVGASVVYLLVASCSGNAETVRVTLENDASTSREDPRGTETLPEASRPREASDAIARDTIVRRISDAAINPVRDAMAQDSYTSGSRLRAVWIEGSDGSRQFFGWFDSQLQIDCGFNRAADGITRCLPRLDRQVGIAANIFLDSACSRRVASPSAQCDPDYAYNLDASSPQCGVPLETSVFEIGNPLGSGVQLYQQAGDSCITFPGDSIGFYPVEGEVSPGSFVGATRVVE